MLLVSLPRREKEGTAHLSRRANSLLDALDDLSILPLRPRLLFLLALNHLLPSLPITHIDKSRLHPLLHTRNLNHIPRRPSINISHTNDMSPLPREPRNNRSSSRTPARERQRRRSPFPALQLPLCQEGSVEKDVRAFERGKEAFEGETSRVGAARVLEALVNADLRLSVGGRQVNGGDDGRGRGEVVL